MVSLMHMRNMNNGLNQESVISMRAVDQKQDYQLEWPNGNSCLQAQSKNDLGNTQEASNF